MFKQSGLPILLGLFFLFSTSCKDEDNNNVPLVEVNILIQLDDPDYIRLKTVGGWEYISGGSRGIIIYRLGENEFRAYDRHCTFQPSSTCALVSVDPNNITASDDCCGSAFLMSDGSVSRPPATTALKQYVTFYDGTTLRVSN
ncbi:MAG: hypothetical protein CMP59_12915 [Flavobacteriales bacterium]|nr:hypothetical protein [Flavobacteriales bacterium]|tara:strand:+ start:3888 stop:4316 length:429 start_codon:yes stop_codon:yes gene_type:complete